MDVPSLESIYDRLADTLDRAPDAARELMLVKLVLLLAREAAIDPARFGELADTALDDL